MVEALNDVRIILSRQRFITIPRGVLIEIIIIIYIYIYIYKIKYRNIIIIIMVADVLGCLCSVNRAD